jgi:ketosteroid isomerase-like protein
MSKIDLVNQAFQLVEDNNVDEYIKGFTDDAIYKIGNLDPVIGPEAIKAFAAPIVENFSKVSHDVKNMWETDDTVFAEMVLTYDRKDGKSFDIPCIDIIEFEGDKVKKLQSYIDVSPLFA